MDLVGIVTEITKLGLRALKTERVYEVEGLENVNGNAMVNLWSGNELVLVL
jgi:hypothetical protein